MARGILTDEVKAVSKKKLGYEISQAELRLMPYTMLQLMDNEPLRRRALTDNDYTVIEKWEKEGFMEREIGKFTVTKKFYRAMAEILLVGYCSDFISG